MTIEQVISGLHRIELQKPEGLAAPAGRPNNVYLIEGDAPALVNAGHPSQFQALLEALRTLGLTPSDIERVVYTSWHIDSLGGATNFPRADHFVCSPDMQTPRRYDERLEGARAALRAIAEEVLERVEQPAWTRDAVEHFVQRYLPRVSNGLDFIPLRAGHSVQAGPLQLEVLTAGATNPGDVLFFEPERRILFSGDLTASGLPDELEDVEAYLTAVERAMGLDPQLLLPTYGQHTKRGAWTLKRALRHANNFLSNAPTTLVKSPTILEYVEADLGHRPDDLMEYLFAIRRVRPFLDELVRARMIEAQGEGLDRRYGTNVDDPREGLR